jgi:peptidoglycan hydrolase-like protein with peptidoglycan-binding domain
MLALGGAAALGYELFWNKEPELQSLRNPEKKTQIVVPVTRDKPRLGLTHVPVPPGNVPAHTPYQVAPPLAKSGPYVHPKAPVLITPSGATNFSMQRIEDVQRALNTLGLIRPPLPVNGLLDPVTTATLVHFQTQAGVPVTGSPDVATKNALEHAIASLAVVQPIAHVVQRASPAVGQAIAQAAHTLPLAVPGDIQKALNQIGSNPPLVIDGDIGPKTTAAVKAFQIGAGLVADGVAGPKTVTALQTAVDSGAKAALGSLLNPANADPLGSITNPANAD